MKQKMMIGTGILLLSGLVFLLFGDRDRKLSSNDAIEHLLGPGTKEDPNAIAQYEWLQHRDPKTGQIPIGIRGREINYVTGLLTNNVRRLAKENSSRLGIENWQWLGPNFNGGRTRTMGIDAEGRYFMAGSVSGGVFKEDNETSSRWRKVTAPDLNQNVTGLAQDAREGKSHIWYYSTGEFRGGAGGGPYRNTMGGGVYKSIDSGETWALLPATVGNGPALFDNPFEATWRVVVDTTADLSKEIIYVAGFGAIMRSSDGGDSWDPVLGNSQGVPSIYTDITMASDGTFYAVVSDLGYNGTNLGWGGTSDRGIWRSGDGLNWTEITPTDWPALFSRTALATSDSDPSILYVISVTPQSGVRDHTLRKYTYLSGDGTGNGGRWEDRSANIPDDPTTDRSWGNDYVSYSGFCISIDVHPTNPDIVILGGSNLYRSDDGFATDNWIRIGGYRTNPYGWAFDPYRAWYFGHHPDHHGIYFWPGDPDVAFSITDGGTHLTFDITADTVEWTWIDDGYITTQFYSVAIDPYTSGDEFIVGGTQDNNIYIRLAEDQSFYPIYAGDGSYCAVDNSTNSFYVSNIDGNFWRITRDSEGSPDSAGFIMPAGTSNHFTHFPFQFDPHQSTRLYLGVDRSIWRNSDITGIPMSTADTAPSSVNWTHLTTTRGELFDEFEIITAIGISTTPANRLYYGRMNGKVFRLDNAHEEDPQPTEITDPDFPKGFVNCIGVDPLNGDRAIVLFSNYNVKSLFLTEDGGETWVDIGGNLEENPDGTGNGPACKWIEILHLGNETIYFLGTTTGLFSTTQLDGASTIWNREATESIGTVPIHQVAVRSVDGKVLVATHGNGLYESTVTSNIDNIRSDSKNLTALHQNQPNPFIGKTTIHFTLGKDLGRAPVRLEIFDLQGRNIATLRDEILEPGEHTVQFNPHSLPQGLYITRLMVDNQVYTRTMQAF